MFGPRNRCPNCRAELGTNHLVPGAGGTLTAYEPSTLRVWAVCPFCARWTLQQLSDAERRDAVRELEWLYERGPARAGDADGVEEVRFDWGRLTRVAAASWSDYALARHGRRRRRLHADVTFGMFFTGLLIVPVALIGPDPMILVPALASFAALVAYVPLRARARRLLVAKAHSGVDVRVSEFEARRLRLETGEGHPRIALPGGHSASATTAEGLRVLAMSLGARNKGRYTPAEIRDAAHRIHGVGGPEPFLRTMLSQRVHGSGVHRITELPRVAALALEIAATELHELASVGLAVSEATAPPAPVVRAPNAPAEVTTPRAEPVDEVTATRVYRRRLLSRSAWIAAGLLLLTGVIYGSGYAQHRLIYGVASAGAREKVVKTLPDGTVATLSPGSRLRYSRIMTGEDGYGQRAVFPSGEVTFQVPKDHGPVGSTANMFIVHTEVTTFFADGARFKVITEPGVVVLAIEEGSILVRLPPRLGSSKEGRSERTLAAPSSARFTRHDVIIDSERGRETIP